MKRYLVSYCLTKGMEMEVDAETEEEAIRIMKEDPDDGCELDHEVENIDVMEMEV